MPVIYNLVRTASSSRNYSTLTAMLTEEISSKCFEGYQKVFSHYSKELDCEAKIAIYLPPQAEQRKVPVLYFLNGLTATHENFVVKSGAQRFASKYGLCLVSPDTSPRNVDIPGQDEYRNLGYSAGFYVDATQLPWKRHYRMYSYVIKELVELIQANFPVIPEKKSISGFSMGGHGALICALKNPGMYCSLSAMAPVCNPIKAPTLQRPYSTYLGSNTEDWKQWDATELVKQYNGPPLDIFLDHGTNDPYLAAKDLLPENLLESAEKNNRVNCFVRWREGYNHSHFYASTFIEEHIDYHMKALNSNNPKL